MRPTPAACLVALALVLPAAAAEAPRAYFEPAAALAPESALGDDLERAVWQTVLAAAAAAHLPAPALDGRLVGFARDLADDWRDDGVDPSLELQEHLLSRHGLGDPPPQLLGVRVTASDATIRGRYAELLPELLARGHVARVGVAVHRRWWNKSVVVALAPAAAELLPIPRQLAADGTALLGGRLPPGLRDARVLVAPPAGEVRTLDVRSSRESFQTIFACDGRSGRHQIELTGVGDAGRTVVANFPVWCGVAPPATDPAFAPPALETTDARRAEALTLARVNQDRAAAGLPAVAWDEALARVARAHSEAMASRELVAHVLPDGGNAADRVRRAGVDATVVFENVARAPSIAEAERSFLTSPAHRANVLARAARRAGVGVTLRPGAGGRLVVYVTQLLAP